MNIRDFALNPDEAFFVCVEAHAQKRAKEREALAALKRQRAEEKQAERRLFWKGVSGALAAVSLFFLAAFLGRAV